MAKLVVIDGPEKAGKTTLIANLMLLLRALGKRSTVKHWSTPNPKTFHSFIYRDWIAEAFDVSFYDVIIWDRSWVSEYVYPGLMPQLRSNKRVMWNDPWIGEWCFGRALSTYGMGLILLGPSERQLEELRDDTDHNCPVFAERERYEYYGNKFNWLTIANFHTTQSAQVIVDRIIEKLAALDSVPMWLRPPIYCGPVDAKVVFMGEVPSSQKTAKTWLPFTSKYTEMLGRELGDKAFDYGWTNARTLVNSAKSVSYVEIGKFFSDKLVVACGKFAADYCKMNGFDYYHISHPAFGFRWGQRVEEYKAAIQSLKNELAARSR